jgi:hypothetical protein
LGKFISTLVNTPLITPFSLMMNNRGIFGLNLLPLFEGPGSVLLQRAFDSVMNGFALQKYRAIIGKTFSLEQAGEAQEYLRSRNNIGKVVLKNNYSGWWVFGFWPPARGWDFGLAFDFFAGEGWGNVCFSFVSFVEVRWVMGAEIFLTE